VGGPTSLEGMVGLKSSERGGAGQEESGTQMNKRVMTSEGGGGGVGRGGSKRIPRGKWRKGGSCSWAGDALGNHPFSDRLSLSTGDPKRLGI